MEFTQNLGLTRWLILFCQSLQTVLRIILDITLAFACSMELADHSSPHNCITIIKYNCLTCCDGPLGLVK